VLLAVLSKVQHVRARGSAKPRLGGIRTKWIHCANRSSPVSHSQALPSHEGLGLVTSLISSTDETLVRRRQLTRGA